MRPALTGRPVRIRCSIRFFDRRVRFACAREGVTIRHCLAVGRAAVAQLVERVLGKDEVTGSIPVSSFGSRAGPAGEL